MEPTDPYEARLLATIRVLGIEAEHLRFRESCHSVADAMRAADAPAEAFVKNVCMIDAGGRLIVAVVPGPARASTSRVGRALDAAPPRLATPEEVLERTGYPPGGTPSFGYPATVLVDPAVMERAEVLTGGGSDRSLVRIAPRELLRASGGRVARVRR
jgi:Cys-tRNA(Pro)/Cys-tRNA(Cys) deacylase